MQRYNPSEIEPKWQKIWQESKFYEATDFSDKPKFYISCMFPYPSAAGMHTGHAFEHTIVDSIARFHRQHGMNVLNPMGWDAFGLPAENYAIKNNVAPQEVTKTNTANFTEQLQKMGVSIDWSREINTSDPKYYKWTQWIFAEFFKRGLAYQKESLQWWCPVDKTVLANEQVVNGRCWRCDNLVDKKSMKQWFLKITDYADALLEEIESLDWPQKIKSAQTNWIGKSSGAEVIFKVTEKEIEMRAFTTRPDTLFGATYVAIAPEHPQINELTNSETYQAVQDYVSQSLKRSEIDRMSEGDDKTGVFTGSYALNPATGDKIPIWVADYVLSGYGTGVVMGVPAHDERDFAFAEKFKLPIIEVVQRPESDDSTEVCYGGEGTLINSQHFNGMSTSDAREQVVRWLEETQNGQQMTTYKMRDWLISRQRYWGAPIPIIHCQTHGPVAVPEEDLPVLLPDVKDFSPKGDGKSVLARETSWVNTTCPECGQPAQRETDTMDGYACSSWYLMRYADPQNSEQAWNPKKANYWAPLDYYVGGDHAVAHLLYVRFWTHVFKDMGLTDFKEPVKKLIYHGLIQDEKGQKMSKSKGNVVDPLDVINQGYGADALRTYLMFLGPIDVNSNWSSSGIAGVYRFLNRVWTLAQEFLNAEKPKTSSVNIEMQSSVHKTIQKVTNDYHRLSFNTVIACLMELTNDLYKFKNDNFTAENWRDSIEVLVQLISPIAPHLSAEIWQQLGNQTYLDKISWPEFDASKVQSNSVTIIVQVNGKLRAKMNVSKQATDDEIKQLATKEANVTKHIDGKQILKTIYVPGKLVNIVVK